MGKKKSKLPTFVYFIVRDFDGALGWGRCPTMGLEDDLLLWSGVSAANDLRLSRKWMQVPRERRHHGVGGQAVYADLMATGVMEIEATDTDGVSTLVFLRPRVLGDSEEDQRWIARAFPLAAVQQ